MIGLVVGRNEITMTRKDYVAFASMIRSTLDGINIESGSNEAKAKATDEVICLADEMANYFKADNRNFDYDRFTEACGFHGANPIDYLSLC